MRANTQRRKPAASEGIFRRPAGRQSGGSKEAVGFCSSPRKRGPDLMSLSSDEDRDSRLRGNERSNVVAAYLQPALDASPARALTTPACVNAAAICCMRLMRSTAAAGGSTKRQAG